MQSVPITTKVVSSNPAHGEVYSIQYYVIQFVSNLWQVSDYLLVIGFPSPIKLTAITLTLILLFITLSSSCLFWYVESVQLFYCLLTFHKRGSISKPLSKLFLYLYQQI